MNMTISRALACVAALLVATTTAVTAQEVVVEQASVEKPETLRQQILGSWVLAGKPDAEVVPKPGARMKFFGLGHWFITEHHPDSGKVIYHHGGTYTLDGDRYVETFAFANENTKHLIGTKLVFKIKVEDGKYTQVGQGNSFTERWVRPKVK